MSEAGNAIKKRLTENQFLRDPNSVTVTVIGSDPLITFPALFSKAFMSDTRDRGHVAQQKRWPHLTFYSGLEATFKARVTKLSFSGMTYTVHSVQTDLTDGTFQGELWLVEDKA